MGNYYITNTERITNEQRNMGTIIHTYIYRCVCWVGNAMSKTGQWVLQMQEEAQVMTFNQFLSKWGEQYADLWTEQNIISVLEDYNEIS